MMSGIADRPENEDKMLTADGTTQEQPLPLSSKRLLLEATVEELQAWMASQGHPGYRVRQVLEWVIQARAESFEPMSDLPLVLRQQLALELAVLGTRIAFHSRSPDRTDKLLLECRDGRRIECVLMAEDRRHTVCISTQVGCGMGCVFCQRV